MPSRLRNIPLTGKVKYVHERLLYNLVQPVQLVTRLPWVGYVKSPRKKDILHFMGTFMFLFPRLHNFAKLWCPSVIAQSRPSDNKQFDSVRFNSSSQIAHICLSLSKGTLKRQLKIFLAHGLCAKAYGSTRSSLGPRGQEGEWAFFCPELRSASVSPNHNSPNNNPLL